MRPRYGKHNRRGALAVDSYAPNAMNAASKQQRPSLVQQAWALLTLVALPSLAAAQAALTVHGGWRATSGLQTATVNPTVAPTSEVKLKDSSFFMLVAGWALDASRELELQFSQQRTHLYAPGGTGTVVVPMTVQNYQVGGTNFWEGVLGQGPYVGGGLGFTRMAPEGEGFTSETRPSLSVALGYQWQVGGLALRAETRANFVVINSSGGLFCSGGCTIAVRGDTMSQLEASLGLGWRF